MLTRKGQSGSGRRPRWSVRRLAGTPAVMAMILLLAPAVASARSITSTGAVGGLRLNAATSSNVIATMGQPAIQESATTGGCTGTAEQCGGPAAFQVLGYRCPADVPEDERFLNCETQFYISAHSRRLVAFATNSPSFVMDGRLSVGSSIVRKGHPAILIATGEPHGSVVRLDVVAASLKPSEVPFGVGLSC
jgi:hypothetical protein